MAEQDPLAEVIAAAIDNYRFTGGVAPADHIAAAVRAHVAAETGSSGGPAPSALRCGCGRPLTGGISIDGAPMVCWACAPPQLSGAT